MSTTSPQAEAAGEQAQWQASLAKMLSGVTQPELTQLLGGQVWVADPPTEGGSGTEGDPRFPNKSQGGHWETVKGALGTMLQSTDASGRMAPDAAIRAQALSQLNQGYAQAKMGSREAISYGGLRSGEGRLGGATGSAITSAATSLDRDRTSALRNLEFMSAQSSLKDYNQVLQLLGQGTQASLGLAQGFSGASGAALGGLSQNTQFGSILGGAASGASLGTTINPGWGTVIGGVVGGAAGALGYGG